MRTRKVQKLLTPAYCEKRIAELTIASEKAILLLKEMRNANRSSYQLGICFRGWNNLGSRIAKYQRALSGQYSKKVLKSQPSK